MGYVDGFVLAVKKDDLQAYKLVARAFCKLWREHGALEFRECAGENLDVPVGLPFPRLANLDDNETAIFSWILYKSRAHRDAVNKKVLRDPRFKKIMARGDDLPFRESRMSFGGFTVLVEDVGASQKKTVRRKPAKKKTSRKKAGTARKARPAKRRR